MSEIPIQKVPPSEHFFLLSFQSKDNVTRIACGEKQTVFMTRSGAMFVSGLAGKDNNLVEELPSSVAVTFFPKAVRNRHLPFSFFLSFLVIAEWAKFYEHKNRSDGKND